MSFFVLFSEEKKIYPSLTDLFEVDFFLKSFKKATFFRGKFFLKGKNIFPQNFEVEFFVSNMLKTMSKDDLNQLEPENRGFSTTLTPQRENEKFH